ncbi:hypothetical protein Ancab_033404 [Ancistrocladus abbreviatus]
MREEVRIMDYSAGGTDGGGGGGIDEDRVLEWEVRLPGTDDLMPLSQPLIPPELSTAFNIKPQPFRSAFDINRATQSTLLSIRGYTSELRKTTQKGQLRLIAILPIVLLFLILPFNLTSVHLTGFTSFFISWLANFKLLLFAFGKGPLSADPSISLSHFFAVACLPIKIQHSQNPSPQNSENTKSTSQRSQNGSYSSPQNRITQKSQNNQNPSQKSINGSCPSPQIIKRPQKSPSSYILKAALSALMLKIYDYIDHLHPKFIWLIYCLHIYLTLEFILAVVATAAKLFLGLELEPQFNEPLLSTSLQDFWGRRWNLMVTSILRPTVYEPVLDTSTRIIGKRPAQLLAVFMTFVLSAVMHELVFYHLGRLRPTLEVTCFFLLHGFFVCVEIAVKKSVSGCKWRLHRVVSGPLTVGFVVATGFWLFLPPLLRFRADERGFEEYAAVGAFVKNVSRSLTLSSTLNRFSLSADIQEPVIDRWWFHLIIRR